MSTVQEIRDAIAKLPEPDRCELLQSLNSEYDPHDDETDEMMAEAAEAEKQIDAGQGVSLAEARKLTRTWITK